MSKLFEMVDGRFYNVDEVFEAMDAGNRQHMANKLFKHGWAAQKSLSYLPEDVLRHLEATREAEQYVAEAEVEVGDILVCQDIVQGEGAMFHGDKYIVMRHPDVTFGDADRLLLVSLADGNLWSRKSLFGSDDTVRFIRGSL